MQAPSGTCAGGWPMVYAASSRVSIAHGAAYLCARCCGNSVGASGGVATDRYMAMNSGPRMSLMGRKLPVNRCFTTDFTQPEVVLRLNLALLKCVQTQRLLGRGLTNNTVSFLAPGKELGGRAETRRRLTRREYGTPEESTLRRPSRRPGSRPSPGRRACGESVCSGAGIRPAADPPAPSCPATSRQATAWPSPPR